MQSDGDEMLIKRERLRSVFQQGPLTQLVTVVIAVGTAVGLAPIVSHRLLVVWTGLIVVVSVARWIAGRYFLRRRPEGAESSRWAIVAVSGSATTGILWGFGATALFPAAETHQLFLAFVIGGMCAGTTAVNSVYMPSVLAFMLPASLPLAASFLHTGSATSIVSALMILVFAVALSVTSLSAHRAF